MQSSGDVDVGRKICLQTVQCVFRLKKFVFDGIIFDVSYTFFLKVKASFLGEAIKVFSDGTRIYLWTEGCRRDLTAFFSAETTSAYSPNDNHIW